MFINNKFEDDISKEAIEDVIQNSKMRLFERNEIHTSRIISILEKLGSLWGKDGAYYKKAINELSQDNLFSLDMLEETLGFIPLLLDGNLLRERMECELGSLGSIEGLNQPFIEKNGSRSLIQPVGKVLHVTAGNVFISFIDSLILSVLTKNISFVKISSTNKIFPRIFFQSFLEADPKCEILSDITCLSWKGGDESIEGLFKKEMDLIVAWGSQEMVESYKKDLPIDTKLIDYGPKISFGIIDEKSANDANILDGIARDVCTWDQAACSNMQNLFIVGGVESKDFINEFIHKLKKSFDNYPIKRAEPGQNEYVEILKEVSQASYLEFELGVQFVKEDEYLIRFDNTPGISPTALNRTLRVKQVDSIKELAKDLLPFKYYLQTCSVSLDKNIINAYKLLSTAGVKRFTKIGSMLEVVNGASHDGHYPMQNFIQRVSIEFPASENEFYELNPHGESKVFFATGGTTGVPKFSRFLNHEFEHMAYLLSKSYLDKLTSRETVANLFVAGNMWSSFILVYKALEKLNLTQLPIGGNSSHEDILTYLLEFKPTSLFGIPSMIYNFANLYDGKINFVIDKVFYAGEGMSELYKKRISDVFGTKKFYSAGYATVDAGMIAYQDSSCTDGEHILFDGVTLDVKDEEAYITSSLRTLEPIVKHATGDKVEIISDNRFRLLGRKDPLITIHGSRITIDQIKESLLNIGYKGVFQVITRLDLDQREVLEIITKASHFTDSDSKLFYQTLLNKSKDLRQTLAGLGLDLIIILSENEFNSKKRTGKTPIYLDLRGS